MPNKPIALLAHMSFRECAGQLYFAFSSTVKLLPMLPSLSSPTQHYAELLSQLKVKVKQYHSRKLRLPNFMTTAQDGVRLSALRTGRFLPPGNTPGTHFC